MKRGLLLLLGVFIVSMAVSAQDLKIDYQFNTTAKDTGNYFSFSGPQRLGQADKDTFDAASGASKQRSTAIFTIAYQTDIAGKAGFPEALRGILFYPVADDSLRIGDNVNVTKAANGAITIQYCHRGTAYKIVTDAQGRVTLPKGNYVKRTVGYIAGANPQVISPDFSSDGTAAKIDWAKVWDAKTPSGKAITGPNAPANAKTGAIVNDWEDSSIFHFAGPLQFAFDGKILKINGTLKAARGAAEQGRGQDQRQDQGQRQDQRQDQRQEQGQRQGKN